ncbi:hypothetical protein EVAR_64758_1 [Eumeta japonica]|uniref:Uncharacterized protein n=1 Tax=Eumeta variegata TaxID=151549 RepID=A0A4C1ZCJ8_EUMVA|nr:hypothetical protein EVAR_64758_1 [Eumeta japonica]
MCGPPQIPSRPLFSPLTTCPTIAILSAPHRLCLQFGYRRYRYAARQSRSDVFGRRKRSRRAPVARVTSGPRGKFEIRVHTSPVLSGNLSAAGAGRDA